MHFKFFNKALDLRNGESILLDLLLGWKLRWRWVDVVEDTLVYCEVHELDS
jgi:hypothetical protein